MLSLKKVNAAIKKLGADLELVKGKNYFYFVGNDADLDKEGVYVNAIDDLSLDSWLEEARYRIRDKSEDGFVGGRIKLHRG